MKKYILFCFILVQFTQAQSVDQSKTIVSSVVKAVNQGSIDGIDNDLAQDFTIAGQKGAIARIVLKQLISQLNDKIVDYTFIDRENEAHLKLNYIFNYERLGEKRAFFIFDKENKIKEMSLLSMEVKTMSGESNVEKSKEKYIDVPFQLAGKLILVDVNLNGKPQKFILDTGSPKVVLNSKYLNKNDKETRLSSSKGVNGNISGMDIENVESLDFYGIQLKNQDVLSMDLSHLEEELGTQFCGLLGYEFIKDYDILFDYANQNLTLIEAAYLEDYINLKIKGLVSDGIPFKMEKHLPVIDFSVGEKIYNVAIDSGAESNLLDFKYSAQLQPFLKDTKQNNTIGADGLQKSTTKSVIPVSRIGENIFNNTDLILTDISHINNAYKSNLDGIIGNPILSQQKVILSYSKNQLFFIKN